jgi:hypothetical protein
VGVNSTPNYGAFAGGVQQIPPDGMRVFAGQRDEGFYVDLAAIFDLLQIRKLPGNRGGGVDGTKGYNVHSIAIEVPISRLSRSGRRPSGPNDPAAVIGVWSTASRRVTRTLAAGTSSESGDYVQVSRLGQPLVNEVVIPRGVKDTFNSLEPTGDGAALQFVTDPELARLFTAIFGLRVPPTPRNDLVTIFLTGIPGLNQPPNVRPSEMLRLNMAIAPVADPDRLGVLGGDIQGFPNGRRVGDDTVDIALRAVAGGTPLTPAFNSGVNADLGDGVNGNDVPYLNSFPYLGIPHPGNDGKVRNSLQVSGS